MRAIDRGALAQLRADRQKLPEFADRAGVGPATVSRAERGEKISESSARAIAGALGRLLEELFTCDATVAVPELVSTVRHPASSLYPRSIAGLHQLPPPDGDFTGRLEELKEVLAAEKAGARIVGIQGPPGVGKTALALKIAEVLSPQYPDAQCYLDLKGMSAQPFSASDAMRHVIRTLRPDAIPPFTEIELAGLYRSILHGKRCILLMDNARDAAHVKPLLPPLSCILLLTSRLHFTLPGSLSRDLTVFSPRHARDLLLAITPRLEFEADAIASLCGYLPLALRAAGTVLAERIDLDPKEYVRVLKNARMRLELTNPTENLSVEASFGLSYDLLNSELQQRFRVLSVFPGTFDPAGAGALWVVHEADARETLGRLVKVSMLQFNPANARYLLHDLIQLFADARLSSDERAIAGHYHAEHFIKILEGAEALYLKGRKSMKRGLKLVYGELSNIRAGQAWSAAHASRDLDAAKLCASYPEAGVHILEFSQPAQERISWLNAGLKAARKLKHRRLQARHMGSLGIAYWRLGEAPRAVPLFTQSLTATRNIADAYGEARALRGLGLALQDLGRIRRAIYCHKQALKIDRHLSDARAQVGDLNNLGLGYAAVGETHSAIKWHRKQLALARKVGDRRGESAALGNLGVVYRKLGNTRRAVKYHGNALSIDLELGDRTGQAGDLGELGKAYGELGKTRWAIKYYERGVTIAHEIGDQRREGDLLFAMARLLAKLGDRTSAISMAEKVLKIFKRIQHPCAAKVRKQIAQWRRRKS